MLKPGKLTKEEFEIMKTHTVEGSEIIEHMKGIGDGEYEKVSYDIARYHHERFDGRGYPNGLVGGRDSHSRTNRGYCRCLWCIGKQALL